MHRHFNQLDTRRATARTNRRRNVVRLGTHRRYAVLLWALFLFGCQPSPSAPRSELLTAEAFRAECPLSDPKSMSREQLEPLVSGCRRFLPGNCAAALGDQAAFDDACVRPICELIGPEQPQWCLHPPVGEADAWIRDTRILLAQILTTIAPERGTDHVANAIRRCEMLLPNTGCQEVLAEWGGGEMWLHVIVLARAHLELCQRQTGENCWTTREPGELSPRTREIVDRLRDGVRP